MAEVDQAATFAAEREVRVGGFDFVLLAGGADGFYFPGHCDPSGCHFLIEVLKDFGPGLFVALA
jgi:hypothetical protein